jgi:hypothetical protein
MASKSLLFNEAIKIKETPSLQCIGMKFLIKLVAIRTKYLTFVVDITSCRELGVLHLMDIVLSKGYLMNSPTHIVVSIWIPDISVRLGGTGH